MICIAPIILAGVMATVPIPYQKTNTDSTVFEAMTCGTGAGLVAHVAPQANLYGLSAQYAWEFGVNLKFRVIPQAGLSHTGKGYRELPSHTQFGVGGEIHLALDKYTLAVKYWHLSNAHTKLPNIGLDTLSIMVGYQF